MEIANIQKSQNNAARDFYTRQAFGVRGVGAIHAYVGSVKDEDIIANKYTVFVPSWGYTYLYKIPRLVPSGKVSSNGVGYRPAALMPGQPVLLKYFEGTNQVYIDGSIHLPGNQQNKIPDENSSFLNAPFDLYNLVDSFAEVESTPLLIGTSNTGTSEGFVSGNHKIQGSNGSVIQNLVGDCFTQTRNINTDIKGHTVSRSEAEIQKVIVTIKRLRHNIERNYETVYSASDGALKVVRRYIPVVDDARNRISRAYNIVRNITVKIERVLELVKEASVITREQIRWLQQDLKPFIINTASRWGLQDRVFNASIGGGLINISARGNLASSFKLTAKVSTGIPLLDYYYNKQLEGLLGGLKLNTNLEIAQHLTKLLGFLGSGVSDQTIVSGRPPFPIQLQGGLFFGAYRIVAELKDIYSLIGSLLNVFSATRGQLRATYNLPRSRYSNFVNNNIGNLEEVTSTPFNPLRVTRANSPTPYLYIDPEINKLNDNQQPELALAALLTKYGVPNALDIVNDTLSLRSTTLTAKYADPIVVDVIKNTLSQKSVELLTQYGVPTTLSAIRDSLNINSASLLKEYAVPDAVDIVKNTLSQKSVELLTEYGVLNAVDIVNDGLAILSNSRDNSDLNTTVIPSATIIPKVLSDIAEGEEKIVMETSVLWLSKEVVNDLELVKAKEEECKVSVSELEDVVKAAIENNQPVVKDVLKNYFLVDNVPESYDDWAFDKESILDWLELNNSDILLTATFLVNGDLTRFFIELIYLTTGNDLLLAPSELTELVDYINRAFNLICLGVE
jgi:hypothetical protein